MPPSLAVPVAAIFVVALGLGAAGLALWFDARLGSIAPGSFKRRVALMFTAWFVLDLAQRAVGAFGLTYLTLFGAVLPAIVFSFVSAIWLFRAVLEPGLL